MTPTPLEIRLLGHVQLRRAGLDLPQFPTMKARSLFAYLVVHRDRLVRREQLQDLFWRDHPEAAAQKALRTCLWRIRTTVDSGAGSDTSLLHTEGLLVGVRLPAGTWLDVAEFESGLRTPSSASSTVADPALFEASVGLYRGHFAEELTDEWCLFARERLRLVYLDALELLMDACVAAERWGEAIRWGSAILEHDPLREHVHRWLIRCHYARGDRPLAIRQFQRCAAVIRSELGIEPMLETRMLHEEVRAERLDPPSALLRRSVSGRPSPARYQGRHH